MRFGSSFPIWCEGKIFSEMSSVLYLFIEFHVVGHGGIEFISDEEET